MNRKMRIIKLFRIFQRNIRIAVKSVNHQIYLFDSHEINFNLLLYVHQGIRNICWNFHSIVKFFLQ